VRKRYEAKIVTLAMIGGASDADPQRKRIKQIETSVKKQLAKISGG
jgi:hypothetical protein